MMMVIMVMMTMMMMMTIMIKRDLARAGVRPPQGRVVVMAGASPSFVAGRIHHSGRGKCPNDMNKNSICSHAAKPQAGLFPVWFPQEIQKPGEAECLACLG